MMGVAACLLACSTTKDEGGAATSTHEPLCDGSLRLRLRFFGEPQIGAGAPDGGVRGENGVPSFFVDGKCQYWIGPDWFAGMGDIALDLGWRSAELPADIEADLNRLPLGHLDTLGGCVEQTFDAPRLIISDASSWDCAGQGPDIEDAWKLVGGRAEQLWGAGVPLSGGIRVSGAPLHSGEQSKVYTWPLQTPLSDFVIAQAASLSYGVSHLITDEQAATQLRDLREQYIADRLASPFRVADGQVMSDGTTTAYVYFRDQLPYEDERGLLSFGAGP